MGGGEGRVGRRRDDERCEIRGTALLSVTIEELGIKRPFSSLSPPPLPSPRATHFPSSSPPIPHPSCVVSFVSSPRHFHSAIVNQRDDDNNNASTFSTSKEQGYNERRRAITILAYVSSAELKKRVFFSFFSLSLFLYLFFFLPLISYHGTPLSRPFFSRARVGYLSIPYPLSFKENLARSLDDREKNKRFLFYRPFSHACAFPFDERKRSLASFFPNCFSLSLSLLIGRPFYFFSFFF